MTIQNMPGPSVPVINPDGQISQVWWQFFVSILNRTGGLRGVDISVLAGYVSDLQAIADSGNVNDSGAFRSRMADLESQVNQGTDAGIEALRARVADLEAKEYGGDAASDALRLRVADLEARANSGETQAQSQSLIPVGYAKLTIAGVTRTIAYY